MCAYLEIRADLQSGRTDSTDLAAVQAEKALQAAEAAAWKGVVGRG